MNMALQLSQELADEASSVLRAEKEVLRIGRTVARTEVRLEPHV